MVRGLLIANVVVFFADVFVFKDMLRELGAFSVANGLFGGRLWELLTFQFIHGGIGHLLANMIGLYVFGPWAERWWGSRRFIAFYLLCGMAGALFFSLLWWLGMFPDVSAYTPLVGASAGIYGILAGVAMIAPNLRVMLIFPPIELSMRQLALAVLGIAVLAVVTGFGGNAGGEAGHLGGAILGFLLVRNPHWLAWAAGRDPEVEIIPPRAFGGPRGGAQPDAALSAEIDRILEKISAQGIHSITPAERATLDHVSNSHNFPS